MKHARTDYNRIQDPAANAELLTAYNTAMGVLAALQSPVPDIGGRRMSGEHTLNVVDALGRLARALTPTLSDLVGRDASDAAAEPVHPIGDDEPVFILRARDKFAPEAVEYWCALLYKGGETDRGRMRRAVNEHAREMRRWGLANGTKVPDTPASRIVDPLDALDDAGAERAHYGGRGKVTPVVSPEERGRIEAVAGGIIELLGKARKSPELGQTWADKLRQFRTRSGTDRYDAALEQLTGGESRELRALMTNYEPKADTAIDPSDRGTTVNPFTKGPGSLDKPIETSTWPPEGTFTAGTVVRATDTGLRWMYDGNGAVPFAKRWQLVRDDGTIVR